ncbi:uncharacterized protein LOC143035217 isoform X2 [Oratosquilla oratoria]|uniref:uncharacterized protein LOC143035217 isoform X2 n=1 Tax=Oratosquilla oratoria TaxID=337810 RepID=UPI003F772EFC
MEAEAEAGNLVPKVETNVQANLEGLQELFLTDGNKEARIFVSQEEALRIETDPEHSSQIFKFAVEESAKIAEVKSEEKIKIIKQYKAPDKEKSSFGPEAIHMLIEGIRVRKTDLSNPCNKFEVYQEIQKELASSGHVYTVEQVQRKWNNLLITYRRIKKSSKGSGRVNRTFWKYFEPMDQILRTTYETYYNNGSEESGGEPGQGHESSSSSSSLWDDSSAPSSPEHYEQAYDTENAAPSESPPNAKGSKNKRVSYKDMDVESGAENGERFYSRQEAREEKKMKILKNISKGMRIVAKEMKHLRKLEVVQMSQHKLLKQQNTIIKLLLQQQTKRDTSNDASNPSNVDNSVDKSLQLLVNTVLAADEEDLGPEAIELIQDKKSKKRKNSSKVEDDDTPMLVETVITAEDAITPKKRKKATWIPPEKKVFINEVIPLYNPSDFKVHFRVSQKQVEDLLVIMQLEYRVESWKKCPLKDLILTALWTLGNLETYREIAKRFETGVSVVWSHLHNFCSMMCKLMDHKISWPTEDALQASVEGFQEVGFPNTVAAMDGCHIQVLKPSKPYRAEDFLNQRNFCSTILFGICDASNRFIHVDIGSPGSHHFSHVYLMSDIAETLQNDPMSLLSPGHHIIADGAFPLSVHVMTPYYNNGFLTATQQKYNDRHCAARRIIGVTFSMLRNRFRRLNYNLLPQSPTLEKMIKTCCILHNMCLEEGDELLDFDQSQEGEIVHQIPFEDLPDGHIGTERALVKRDAIAEQL